jgi:hypothetical protein
MKNGKKGSRPHKNGAFEYMLKGSQETEKQILRKTRMSGREKWKLPSISSVHGSGASPKPIRTLKNRRRLITAPIFEQNNLIPLTPFF